MDSHVKIFYIKTLKNKILRKNMTPHVTGNNSGLVEAQLTGDTLLYVVFKTVVFVICLSNNAWCWETHIMSLSAIVVDVVAVGDG